MKTHWKPVPYSLNTFQGYFPLPNKIIFYLLESNCFTVLRWFLPYNEGNQLYVYTHIPFLLVLPSTSTPPAPLGHPRALELERGPCPIQQLPTFTHGNNVHRSMLLSQFVPPSPSHSVSTYSLSMSESLFSAL